MNVFYNPRFILTVNRNGGKDQQNPSASLHFSQINTVELVSKPPQATFAQGLTSVG